MIRFIITSLIIITFIFLIYKLIPGKLKINKRFNKPLFKIPIGILLISIVSVGTFQLVKLLPIVMKLLLIGIDFIIIYSIITYLFNNKQKTN
jgi:hypothetical protein